MIGMGGATRYSILMGRGEKEKGNQVIFNAVAFSVIISLLTLLIGIYLPDQISNILGAKENIHQMTNIYIRVIAIYNGLAQGMQPLLNNSYGKGNRKDLKYIFKLGIITALLLSIVIYGFTYFNAEWMVSLFNNEGNQTLVKMGADGLRLYFIAFFFMGLNIIATVYSS